VATLPIKFHIDPVCALTRLVLQTNSIQDKQNTARGCRVLFADGIHFYSIKAYIPNPVDINDKVTVRAYVTLLKNGFSSKNML